MKAGVPSPLSASATSLDSLRLAAARDPKAAVKEAARQFEAQFMNELMKSMRATTMSSGLFDNSGTQMGTEMLDQQYAMQLSGLPGGLADLIARQLERQMGVPAAPTTPAPAAAQAPAGATQAPQAGPFVKRHAAAAAAAAAETGIPAPYILAQAAHESGWGTREITAADGRSAHNLFGIKAGAGWTGPTADVTTTEFVNGQPRKVTQAFRSYASYDDAFRDWARMMKSNPRYAGVVAHARNGAEAFAQGLQSAGYATDPQYAAKLGRTIAVTQSLQQHGGA